MFINTMGAKSCTEIFIFLCCIGPQYVLAAPSHQVPTSVHKVIDVDPAQDFRNQNAGPRLKLSIQPIRGHFDAVPRANDDLAFRRLDITKSNLGKTSISFDDLAQRQADVYVNHKINSNTASSAEELIKSHLPHVRNKVNVSPSKKISEYLDGVALSEDDLQDGLQGSSAHTDELLWLIPAALGCILALVIIGLICVFGLRKMELKMMGCCYRTFGCCAPGASRTIGEEGVLLEAKGSREMTRYRSESTRSYTNANYH